MPRYTTYNVQTAGGRTKRKRNHSSRRRSTQTSRSPIIYIRRRGKAIVKWLSTKPLKTKRDFVHRMQMNFPHASIHHLDSPNDAVNKALKPKTSLSKTKDNSRLTVALMTILGILTVIGVGITSTMLRDKRQQTHVPTSITKVYAGIPKIMNTNTVKNKKPRTGVKIQPQRYMQPTTMLDETKLYRLNTKGRETYKRCQRGHKLEKKKLPIDSVFKIYKNKISDTYYKVWLVSSTGDVFDIYEEDELEEVKD